MTEQNDYGWLKRALVPVRIKCERCDGDGVLSETLICPTCEGRGLREVEVPFTDFARAVRDGAHTESA